MKHMTSLLLLSLTLKAGNFKAIEGKYTYFEARVACQKNLGSKWRVPEIWELFMLKGETAVYGKDKRFWSGNTLGEARVVKMQRHENEYFVMDKDIPAFAFYLQDGDITPTPKMIKAYLICTDKEKIMQSDEGFIRTNEGVIDENNDLIWENEDKERQSVKKNYRDAVEYCDDKKDGGRYWRLPSLDELYSIVNYNYVKPSVNKEIFGKMALKYYWSSDTFGMDSAYVVGFSIGSVATSEQSNLSHFRCVSDR